MFEGIGLLCEIPLKEQRACHVVYDVIEDLRIGIPFWIGKRLECIEVNSEIFIVDFSDIF